MTLLTVSDLSVAYHTGGGSVTAVDRVNFTVDRGEIFGIVGESGCGKSTLGDAVPMLLDDNGSVTGGSIMLDGDDLTRLSEKALAQTIRGRRISMVFQDPNTSLDPVYTIGQQVTETILTHEDVSSKVARKRAIELLDDVGIPDPEERLDDYPHSFSGGQRQRIVIAIALSCNPDLLIADEPTTGLDVSIQAQILGLLRSLAAERNVAIMIITHNFGVVAETCDRVGVMYAGNMIEQSSVNSVFEDPKHPYTQALLNSLPERHTIGQELSTIPGSPPDLADPPAGCRFHPRCTQVCGPECETDDIPPTYDVDGEEVACYLYDDRDIVTDSSRDSLATGGEER